MAWIKTMQKPEKMCIENPDFPVSNIFENVPWKLSGGTKQACMVSAALILALDIQTVVEIGAWQGFSSLILGRALAANAIDCEPMLLTVDINPRALERSKKMTERLPIEHQHVEADSMNFPLKDHLRGRAPGLCFIDGNHAYEYCRNDIEICSLLLPKWGVMVVHDYSKNGFPGVYLAVNEFLQRSGWQSIYCNENRVSTDYRTIVIQRNS
jgi:predicted O-methyltransferase YrrM